ncbi:hypothetical protein SAMN05428975_4910 [Mucilaginibacter sp. OK268]|jgi:Spy/CpxP family protein refolding chaperone|nr:hypothetical protein [Mucilaginibacter sp. OK268]SDP99111.1 hypothetical protein SAMN05428975_4910 [Mucilaginibacter sp. OK268]
MKALKILAVVLFATFAYTAANAQTHHRVVHRHHHHVVHHPRHHKM